METYISDPFILHLQSINEDIKTLEKLHTRLQDTIPLINTLHTAASIKQLQATMDSHIDHLFLVSKAIIERLSIHNFHEDHDGNGTTTSTTTGTHHHHHHDDQPWWSSPSLDVVVSGELAKKIKGLMDGFQGLRLKIVGLYKETIESIYCRVTKEKQSVETIENLISTGEIDTFLRVAALDHQEASVGILDVVQEIQERINNAKFMQNYLIKLHRMFLDMLALLEAHRQKLCPPPTPQPAASASIKFDDDHVSRRRMEKATNPAAIIMLVMIFILLVILIVILFVSLIRLERERERDPSRL